MGNKNSKQTSTPADVALQATNTAAPAAAPVSESARKVSDYDSKLWDIYSGKTTFDVNNLPNSNVLMPLYNQAKQRSETRVGTGLKYGEGGNENLISAVREQTNDERARDAAGQLETNVFNTFNGLPESMLADGSVDQQSRDNAFSRQYQLYNTQAGIQAQKDAAEAAKPKWWQQILSAGFGVAGQTLAGLGSKKSTNPLSGLSGQALSDYRTSILQ